MSTDFFSSLIHDFDDARSASSAHDESFFDFDFSQSSKYLRALARSGIVGSEDSATPFDAQQHSSIRIDTNTNLMVRIYSSNSHFQRCLSLPSFGSPL
jgi:hypothetical protein